jgi:iron-sulfur cluster assembly enzyme ISCU, mitochondrial
MMMMLSLARRTAGRTLVARTPVRGYHENIVEHYENPRNVGSFNKNDDSVGTVRPPVLL